MRIRNLLNLFLGVFCLSSVTLCAFEQKVIQNHGLEFWSESFGNKNDPALLLIMGTGCQGHEWPQKFCEALASKGYFVIRYDHRDTGLSSSINYDESPYTLADMANDVTSILDGYGIDKAHIVGYSLGGLISMIVGAKHPERLKTLTLLSTTLDFRPVFDALEGKPSKGQLSQPTPEYLSVVKSYLENPPKTLDDKIKHMIEMKRAMNGSKAPFDEGLWHQLTLQSFVRMRNPEGLNNQVKATHASFDLYNSAASKIIVPTLIIHGDQDITFPLDHGKALEKAITYSELAVIPNMGHLFSTQFYATIIKKIDHFISSK